MTVREIQTYLEEMYGTEVSPTLISSVTDAVNGEVKAWQARPINPVWPIVYLAIGVAMTGEKEVLGLWLANNEGAKFWLQVVTELRRAGASRTF